MQNEADADGHPMMRRMALVALLALVAAACSSTAEPGLPSATPTSEDTELDEPELEEPELTTEGLTTERQATAPIYQSLALDTPEQAVESFIDAYDDRDFVRAWFIFDAHAQQRLSRALNNLRFGEYRRATRLVPPNVIDGSGEHPFWNSPAMIARLFDDAAQLGHLHVDLASARIERTEDGATADDGSPTFIVTVSLADDTEARLWMTTTPTDRWRVHRVAIDGVDFDDSGKVFVDATCGEWRVRVHPGAECPSAEASDWRLDPDTVAEVERLRAEAGEDTSAQIAVAQQIQNLVAGSATESDEQICAALQGSTSLVDGPSSERWMARAEELIVDTCPGSIELITNPPDLPPSGAEVGEQTVYGRLDLSTPENAVLTFSELFTNEAFMLLFFTLDAEAQNLAARSINNLDPSTIVDPRVLETWDGVDSEAHFNTFVGSFASLLTEAGAVEGHVLDLAGPLEVIGTTSTTWTEPRGAPVDAHIVEARSELLGTVYFLMIESPSGRWRVRQASLDATAFDSAANKRLVFVAS